MVISARLSLPPLCSCLLNSLLVSLLDFNKTKCFACSFFASHAAKLSDVTSQFCGIVSSASTIWLGSQTMARCCQVRSSISHSLLAIANFGFMLCSTWPYWSMASTASLCAAASLILDSFCAWRTASAKTPPPGTMIIFPSLNFTNSSSQRSNSGEPNKLPPIFTTHMDSPLIFIFKCGPDYSFRCNIVNTISKFRFLLLPLKMALHFYFYF